MRAGFIGLAFLAILAGVMSARANADDPKQCKAGCKQEYNLCLNYEADQATCDPIFQSCNRRCEAKKQ